MRFAPSFPKEKLIFSQTATRRGIDNEPSEQHERNLVRLSWFLETLSSKLASFYGSRMTLTVTSGYRSPELNAAIGGASNSFHTRGLAADLVATSLTSLELAEFIRDHMVEEGFDTVIHEFGRWVHVNLADATVPRLRTLTARKMNGKTIYDAGLRQV